MSLKSIAPVPFDWRNIPVYPAANCVRLMREDEKQALKADMDARGLLDPITLGRINGMLFLIDGRNRLSTCEDLGIEPRFETLEFTDDDAVRAFVVSRSARRDLSKGERAASIALLFPDAPMGRGKSDDARKSAETADISDRRLRAARQVGRFSVQLLESVRDGTVKLDDALTTVRTETNKLAAAEEGIDRLRADAPDLADLVAEDRMSIDEATAALRERERQAKITIDHGHEALWSFATRFAGDVTAIAAAKPLSSAIVVSSEQFATVQKALKLLQNLMETQQNG